MYCLKKLEMYYKRNPKLSFHQRSKAYLMQEASTNNACGVVVAGCEGTHELLHEAALICSKGCRPGSGTECRFNREETYSITDPPPRWKACRFGKNALSRNCIAVNK